MRVKKILTEAGLEIWAALNFLAFALSMVGLLALVIAILVGFFAVLMP